MNNDSKQENVDNISKIQIREEVKNIDNPKNIVKIEKPTPSNDDIIYYNIKMYNDLESEKPLLAQMSETRSTPLISNCSDYYIGVQRFTIPVNIPLQIYASAENVNTLYKVGLTYANTTIVKTIDYINYTTLFEYVKDREIIAVQQILDMINAAYAKAYTDLVAAEPAFAALAVDPPLFVYDSGARLISLIANEIYGNWERGPPFVFCAITMTFPFYLQYLIGLPTRGPPFNPTGAPDIVFIVKDNLINRLTVGSKTYIKMNAEFDMRSLYNQFSGIILETSSIPSNPEYIQSQNNITSRILTDFEPTAGFSNGDPIQFSTAGLSNVRWHAMNAQQPLDTFDIKIFVQYKTGEVFPLNLFEGDLATMKIVFVKKDFLMNIIN